MGETFQQGGTFMKKKIVVGTSIVACVTLILFFVINKAPTKNKELEKIAADTYLFFEEHTNHQTGLTADRLDLGDNSVVSPHTSPTNIAMYMMSTIAAVEMDLIDFEAAEDRMASLLNTLKGLKKWNGLYYNWYFTENGVLKTDWGEFISTVDNGWLSAGLMTVSEYFPELSDTSNHLLNEMDYSLLYDDTANLFHGGFDAKEDRLTDHHYGTLYSETRLASYIAIGKGNAPTEHWWHLNRTFLPTDTWQTQKPEGSYQEYDGIQVYQGYYEYEGIKYVPSWGGSMFEALMPGLVMNELNLSVKGLGLNNKRHVEGQIKYAEKNNLPAWGFSPAGLPDGYSEFGAPVMGISGYANHSVATPHATFLALDYNFEAVFENLDYFNELDVYGEYGYLDSINLETNTVTQSYLALDQGMIMVAIANYLEDDLLRDLFHQHSVGQTPEEVLKVEDFMIE